MFDEGHHLFDAADSTFAAALTGQEAIELRRWMLGPERAGAVGGAASPRGSPTSPPMTRKAASARRMPARRRGSAATAGSAGSPKARRSGRSRPARGGARRWCYARARAGDAGYGLETEAAEPDGALVEARPPPRRRSKR